MFDPSRLSALVAKYRIQRPSLASDMNVSVQTIHNWCSGRIPTPIHQIERLVERLQRGGASDSDVSLLVADQLEAHGLSSSFVFALSTDSAAQASQGSVMLVAWDMKSGGMFPHFAHSCREAIEAIGYTCLVLDCGGAHSMKRTYIREAVRRRYAGLLLIGVPGAFPDPDDDLLTMIEPLSQNGIPTVMVTPWRGNLPLPTGVAGVGWDSDAANDKALETLFDLGHSDVAVLLSATGPLVTGRYQGIERSFESLGRKMRDDLIVWVDGDDDDLPETSRVLRSATAVLARASTLSTLTNACYTQGLRWPRDLSVITVAHSQAQLQLGTNPFTYVSVPVRRISQGAAHLLASLAIGDQAPYSQQFIVYGSSSMRLIHEQGGSIGALTTDRVGASEPMVTSA
jgi:DNA-binding LacI/PurR family transcriptional regulator